MYHYVRSEAPALPHFIYLHVDDFVRQIDLLLEEERPLSRAEFSNYFVTGEVPADGFVLTFDDGFREHFENVIPALLKRGLWGIFFVPTRILTTPKLLDVHRVHHLLGAFGGEFMMSQAKPLISDDMIMAGRRSEFSNRSYKNQIQSENVTAFKQLFNYFLVPQARSDILDQLMAKFFDEQDLHRDLYMTREMVSEARNAGMVIGSHGVAHEVMTTLSETDRETEYVESRDCLLDAAGTMDPPLFCYPYGISGNYDRAWSNELSAAGYSGAFCAEAINGGRANGSSDRFSLPRIDCAALPHGKARGT